ncbi:neural cell adhesion molecule 1-like [Hemiscyllium ocellatum]|uniref:neural cell adhesion molecule 1-like n=1 Tax=Hemiscyllium ocellatum TaxID=170820 RepID=UPI002966CBC4|nr:neural cell adhesion molecule 1-like [Hemiscyllium ocellatum]
MFWLSLTVGFLFMGLGRAVKLTVSPQSVNIILNREKVVICKVQGSEAESFQWYNPDGVPIEEPGDGHFTVTSTEYSSKLQIRDAQQTDSGEYRCEAEVDSGNVEQAAVVITVIAPVSVSNVDPVRNFDEGTDGVLSCTVTGIPEPTLTWTRESQDVLQTAPGHYEKLRNGSLVIRNITMSDAGIYQCVGTILERKEKESRNTTVIVNYSPKLLQVSPEEVSTWPGRSVTISCSVHSVPPVTITWIHNGQGLPSISRTVSGRDPSSVSSTLEVKVHEPTDWGEYRCLAENRLGQVNGSTWVRPGDFPSIPQDVHVEPNSTSLRVSMARPLSDGHLTLLGYTVQWRLDTETEWSSTNTSSEGVSLGDLRPSSLYHVRVAAENGKGLGEFAPAVTVSTLSQREPDPPSVSNRSRVEGNSYRIYFGHPDNGSNPILKYNIRYREEAAADWLCVSVNVTDAHVLTDLKWATPYILELEAENQSAASPSQQIHFRTPENPHSPLPVNAAMGEGAPLGTGAITGIILGIFLVLFVVVDAACYYTNRCGILLCIAVHVLGKQGPGSKRLDQEMGVTAIR